MPLASFAQDEFDVVIDNQTTTKTVKVSNRNATQTAPQVVKTTSTTQPTEELDEFGDPIVPQVIEVKEVTKGSTSKQIAHFDEADIPEGLLNLDSLLSLYNNQTYLQANAECDLPNYNPTYDDEVYIERLAKLPTIFEMPYNDVVRQMIDRYTVKNRHGVSVMLATQNFYMPIFEEALESYNLPLELRYLPVIESGLNPRAVSRAGATGLWQFMLGTARQYGLEVNSLVDMRCDPIKSSEAAAKMLYDLYQKFGDWSLVIAAYNCGPGNIEKAISRAGGERDYWKIYPYLPKETRGYVPAFIAANYVMNYYCEHNICPMLSRLPELTDTVRVDRDVHFDQIAKVLGVPVSQLQELNPQYRKNIVNGSSGTGILRLPHEKAIEFAANEATIYQDPTFRQKRTTVTPGYDGPSTAATQPAPTVGSTTVASTTTSSSRTSTRSYTAPTQPTSTRSASAPTQMTSQRNYTAPSSSESSSRSKYSSDSDRSSKRSESRSSSRDEKKDDRHHSSSKDKDKKDDRHSSSKDKKDDRHSSSKDKKDDRHSSSKDSKKSSSSRDSKSSSKSSKDSKKDSKKPSSREHTVKEGESLSTIAHKNGTTVAQLRKLNPQVKGDLIRTGSKLKVK